MKTHAAIEVDSFLVISYELTASNIHDSQVFSDVWNRLPKNIVPILSLADSAYHGEACLAAARLHGRRPCTRSRRTPSVNAERKFTKNAS